MCPQRYRTAGRRKHPGSNHPSDIESPKQRVSPQNPAHGPPLQQFGIGHSIKSDNIVLICPEDPARKDYLPTILYPQEDATMDFAFTNERTVFYLVCSLS